MNNIGIIRAFKDFLTRPDEHNVRCLKAVGILTQSDNISKSVVRRFGLYSVYQKYLREQDVSKRHKATTKEHPVNILRKQALELIQDSKGKIFTATFIKKDGSERVMTCRVGVKKHLKGGVRPYDAEGMGYIPVFDMAKEAYRVINAQTITALKINGNQYKVINRG